MKMNRKFLKFVVMCIVCVMLFGNVISVYANDTPMITEEFNDNTVQWKELIEEIAKIKRENPLKSEEEIVSIVSIRVNTKDGINRGILDIWNALTETEKKLLIKYPFAALKVNDAKNIATRQTERKFGHNGLGDRSDAFRHGIWNAEMTILIGAEKAELFATAHEEKDTTGVESDGHTKLEHKNMDLHNNSVGREIGLAHSSLSEEQMADYIYDVIYQENTPFVWLND